MAEGYREKFSILIQVFEGMGGLLNVGWAYWTRHWFPMLWIFYLAPLILLFFMVVFLVVDTPICLATRYTPAAALKNFRFIARMNGKLPLNLTENDLEEVHEAYNKRLKADKRRKSRKFTIVDLFRYRSILLITVLSTILHMTQITCFYGPVLLLDQFNLSIFINGIVVGLS